MLSELEQQRIKELNYIPDSLLKGYLDGKLLVRPDYPSTTGTEVKSRYEEFKANMRKNQDAMNKRNMPRKR